MNPYSNTSWKIPPVCLPLYLPAGPTCHTVGFIPTGFCTDWFHSSALACSSAPWEMSPGSLAEVCLDKCSGGLLQIHLEQPWQNILFCILTLPGPDPLCLVSEGPRGWPSWLSGLTTLLTAETCRSLWLCLPSEIGSTMKLCLLCLYTTKVYLACWYVS